MRKLYIWIFARREFDWAHFSLNLRWASIGSFWGQPVNQQSELSVLIPTISSVAWHFNGWLSTFWTFFCWNSLEINKEPWPLNLGLNDAQLASIESCPCKHYASFLVYFSRPPWIFKESIPFPKRRFGIWNFQKKYITLRPNFFKKSTHSKLPFLNLVSSDTWELLLSLFTCSVATEIIALEFWELWSQHVW